MNKKPKKLSLSQETLRNLTPAELKIVIGGSTDVAHTCGCNTGHSVCFGTCHPGAVPKN